MRARLALAVTAVAVGVAVAAPAAHAYDVDRYTYAAGHMIQPSDIPAGLSMKPAMNFSAGPDFGKTWLCSKGSKSVEYVAGTDSYFANYSGRANTMSNVGVSVSQFDSSDAADKAFAQLKKKISNCDGTTTGSNSYEDGTSTPWERLVTSGVVPGVTVTGVQSLFLNVNFNDASGGVGESSNSDNYQVFTLVDDVIISTNYYTGSELNIPTSQRKLVNQVAFNAVTRWVG